MTQALRDFIAALDTDGDLLRVQARTDWRYAIGEETRREQHRGSRRALLFEDLTDYPRYSVFTNGCGTHARIARALGVAGPRTLGSVARIVRERFAHPIAPVDSIVDEGEFSIHNGDAVDLLTLPVPWWHPRDGGRYIGTWHLNITTDVVTGTRNVGVYRMMVLDARTATVSVSGASHLAEHIRRAHSLGRALGMAVAIGVAEPLVLAAAAALPDGVDELAAAGGLIGAPVDTVRCMTVDVEAPLDSEIVLEGEIRPGEAVTDGPFLDYAGVASVNPSAYRFDVTGMRVRNNAVFRGAAIGMPGAEDHILYALLAQLNLVDFHGNRAKRLLQSFFFRMQWFRCLQLSGRFGMIGKVSRTA